MGSSDRVPKRLEGSRSGLAHLSDDEHRERRDGDECDRQPRNEPLRAAVRRSELDLELGEPAAEHGDLRWHGGLGGWRRDGRLDGIAREPDDDQIEVAVAALQATVDAAPAR